MKEEEGEGEEEGGEATTNGFFFDEWETHNHQSPPSSSSSSSSPSSSHFLSSLQIPTTHHHHHDGISIFPPVNHEGLPISQPTLSLSTVSPPSPPPPPPPPLPPRNNTQLVNWFDFSLHLWNSKLLSIITHIGSSGFLSFSRPVGIGASILGFFWFWIRWRRRKFGGGGGERIEQLKFIVKEKDEKILRLLEQIAELNKVLLTRYRIPVLKPS